MRISEQFEMMVCFRDQRRFIQVKLTDSNSAIQQACFHVYDLNRSSGSRSFQIQFYQSEYQQFVDLETNELKFVQLLALLASSEAPPRPDIHWCLRIIETTMSNTRSSSRWNKCAIHPSLLSRSSATSDHHWRHLRIPTSQWCLPTHERSRWKSKRINPAEYYAIFVYRRSRGKEMCCWERKCRSFSLRSKKYKFTCDCRLWHHWGKCQRSSARRCSSAGCGPSGCTRNRTTLSTSFSPSISSNTTQSVPDGHRHSISTKVWFDLHVMPP